MSNELIRGLAAFFILTGLAGEGSTPVSAAPAKGTSLETSQDRASYVIEKAMQEQVHAFDPFNLKPGVDIAFPKYNNAVPFLQENAAIKGGKHALAEFDNGALILNNTTYRRGANRPLNESVARAWDNGMYDSRIVNATGDFSREVLKDLGLKNGTVYVGYSQRLIGPSGQPRLNFDVVVDTENDGASARCFNLTVEQ